MLLRLKKLRSTLEQRTKGRKRLYEQKVEQLGNFQLRIHDQMIMLRGAKAATETVDALRTEVAALKAMQKASWKCNILPPSHKDSPSFLEGKFSRVVDERG